MGKTVTTELAFLHAGADPQPGRTRATRPAAPPRARRRRWRPGQVPLAVGTQTGGSVIRPAAFCGVVGFKPSFGAIPRTGILAQSPSLDTVGVFARSVPDAALLADALFGHDPRDRATAPAPPPRLLETAARAPPVPPVFAFVRPPGWDAAAPETRAALEELAGLLGEQCFEAPLPGAFDEAAAVARAHQLRRDGQVLLRLRAPRPRPALRARCAPRSTPARRSPRATTSPRSTGRTCSTPGSTAIFDRCDAILAPAAPGPAPRRPGQHRQPDLQRPLDAGRRARRDPAAARGRRPADGRTARSAGAATTAGCCAPPAG